MQHIISGALLLHFTVTGNKKQAGKYGQLSVCLCGRSVVQSVLKEDQYNPHTTKMGGKT